MRLLAAFVIAVLVRAAYVTLQNSLQLFNLSFAAGDAVLYLDVARSIAEGHGMERNGVATAYVGPVYPLFLAVLVRLGLDTFGIAIVQSVLGGFTAVLAGLSAGELSRAAGLGSRERQVAVTATAIGAALYPHLVFWSGYVLTEPLFTFLVAASLYLWLVAVRTGTPMIALAAGAISAMSALTRPPFLIISVVLLVMLAAIRWSSSKTQGSRVISSIVFAIGLAVPMGLWTARNIVDLGAPVITTTEAGYVLYQGNARGSTGGTRGYVDRTDYPSLDEFSSDEVEQDSLYLRRAIRDVMADPSEAMGRLPAKVVNMWRPTYEDASVRNTVVTVTTYLPLMLFGIVGAGWLSARGRALLMPAVVLGSWFFIHVIATGMIRFRLTAELVLLETMPFGALALRSWIQHRTRGPKE